MLDLTIDTPASIAILGAGPIGLEAAIYGRYLGYDIHVFEAGQVGQSLADRPAAEMPEAFERCCSPLGLAAIHTHDPDLKLPPGDRVLVAGMYRDFYLDPLASTDLLAGRVHLNCRVRALELVEVEGTAEDESEEEIPADFRLVLADGATVDMSQAASSRDAEEQSATERLVFEAVIDASGTDGKIDLPPGAAEIDTHDPDHDLLSGVPYLMQLGRRSRSEISYLGGLEQIRRLYVRFTGREKLDLYRLTRF